MMLQAVVQDFIIVDHTLDVHHIPVLHLNTNRFVFSCSTGIIGMRYVYSYMAYACIPVSNIIASCHVYARIYICTGLYFLHIAYIGLIM